MSCGAETIIYVYILFVNYRAYVFDITFLYYSQKHCVWLVFVLQFKHFISYIVEVVTRAILFSLISFNHADYDSSRFIVSFFSSKLRPSFPSIMRTKKAADWFNPLPSYVLFNLRAFEVVVDFYPYSTSASISALRKRWSLYSSYQAAASLRSSDSTVSLTVKANSFPEGVAAMNRSAYHVEASRL